MNKVILIGRLTADPNTTETKDTTVTRIRIAVDRRASEEADFINVVAFGKTAEFVDKYFSKGRKIVVSGRLQTGSYQNMDKQMVYTTDVIAEEVEFGDSKKEESTDTKRSYRK